MTPMTHDCIVANNRESFDEELDFIPSAALRAGINYDIKYRMGGEFGELVNESAEADSPEDGDREG